MSSINRHLLYAIGVFLGLLIIGGAFVTWPKYRQARDAIAEQQALRTRMRDINVHTRALESLTEEVAALRHRVQNEHKRIPAAADTHEVITTLSGPIEMSAAREPTFTTGKAALALEEEEGATVYLAPLGVRLRADFGAVFNVLRTTEHMDRLVRVRSLHLTVPTERPARRGDDADATPAPNQSPSLVASIDLEILYEPEADRTASADRVRGTE